jgi:hypothetical protein
MSGLPVGMHTLVWRVPGGPLYAVQGAWEAVSELFTLLVDAGVAELEITSQADEEDAREVR